MEGNQFSMSSLLIVTLLALVVPLLVSRIRAFRIPIVVGEIVVGVIVGKSGLNLVHGSEWLQFLQFFGLAYLMFVSGLEIDFQALRPNRADGGGRFRWLVEAPVFGAVTCAATFLLSYGLAEWLYHQAIIKSPLLFALILTTTSLTVVVPVLKEYNLLGGQYGQLLLAAAVFADFFTMLLISVAASLFQGGFSPSILLVFILGIALWAIYFVFQRASALHGAFRRLAHGTAQLGIRGAFALMIVFLVLAQTLGVQVILGTFLAGILVSLISKKESSTMQHKLDAIGFGFFIPIFFIMVGVNFDLRTLFQDPKAVLLLPVLFVATYLFKGVPALLLRVRYPWRDTFAGAILLTTQMSVTVAATEVGVHIGAISEGIGTAIILVAMLTSVISPITFGKLLPTRTRKADKWVVVVGGMPETQLFVEQLKKRNEHTRWLTVPEDTLVNELSLDALGITPDATKALVVYSADDDINLHVAKQAENAGIDTVVCGVRDLALYQQEQQNNAFLMVHPQLSLVHFLDQLVRYPVSSQMMKAPDHLLIEEVPLRNRRLDGVPLMDVRLPGGLLVLSIVRNRIQLIPHGDTKFQVGDTVTIVGERAEIEDFRRLTESDPER